MRIEHLRKGKWRAFCTDWEKKARKHKTSRTLPEVNPDFPTADFTHHHYR